MSWNHTLLLWLIVNSVAYEIRIVVQYPLQHASADAIKMVCFQCFLDEEKFASANISPEYGMQSEFYPGDTLPGPNLSDHNPIVPRCSHKNGHMSVQHNYKRSAYSLFRFSETSMASVLNKATTDKLVTSSDGAKIFAQSVGDTRLPTLVFIHRFSYSALVWASALRNADLLRNFHLVSIPTESLY